MMSISAVSEAVVKRLLRQLDGGACLPSEPCSPCTNTRSVCEGGRIQHYYTQRLTNCYGECSSRRRTCYVSPGRLC